MIIEPVALGARSDERAGLPKLGSWMPCPEWAAGTAHLGLAVWLSGCLGSSLVVVRTSEINNDGQRLLVVDDCVIDSRGCDESIPYHAVPR